MKSGFWRPQPDVFFISSTETEALLAVGLKKYIDASNFKKNLDTSTK